MCGIQFGLWSKNGIYSRRRSHRRTQCVRLRLYVYVVQSQLFTSISNLTVWITVIGYSNQRDQSFLALYTYVYSRAMCARCGLDWMIYIFICIDIAFHLKALNERYWREIENVKSEKRAGGVECRMNVQCNVLAFTKTRTYGALALNSYYPYRKFPI